MHDPVFRNKITWYSFFFSLLVVWIHAYNSELFLGTGAEAWLPDRIETFLGEGIGQIAVPGFFMISGYLFFCGFTWEKLWGKWMRRIRSVLVPYILWNGIYYAGYLIGSRLPWMRHVVGKGTIPFSFPELTEALLHYKYNPVFWYMYQLMFLIALAPVFYTVLRRGWSAAVWFLLLGTALAAGKSLPLLNVDALIYYSAAAQLAIVTNRYSGKRADGAGRGNHLPLCGAFLIVLAAIIYRTGLRFAVTSCFVICRLAAVIGLWLLVPAEILPEAGEIIRRNFFLYATHFAFVRLINKTAARILPPDPVIPLILYLLMPVIVLGISTSCFSILKRYTPRLCSILNGGR